MSYAYDVNILSITDEQSQHLSKEEIFGQHMENVKTLEKLKVFAKRHIETDYKNQERQVLRPVFNETDLE